MKIFCLFIFVTLFALSNVFAQKYTGVYRQNITVQRKNITGELKMTEVKKRNARYLLFDLRVGSTGPNYSYYCVGDMKGKAKWIEANIAEYNSDFNEVNSEGETIGCRLSFVFSGNTVTIRETNCNDSHGVVCNFEGKFVRFIKKKRNSSK